MNKLIYLWMMLVGTFGTCYGCQVAFGQEATPKVRWEQVVNRKLDTVTRIVYARESSDKEWSPITILAVGSLYDSYKNKFPKDWEEFTSTEKLSWFWDEQKKEEVVPLKVLQVAQQEVPPESIPVPEFHVAPGVGILPEYAPYTLARFNLGEVKAAVDVYTIYNGKVLVTEAIETAKKGEFVFTGPPGRYTVRITTYDPMKGFATVSAETVIKSPSGVVDPLPPPVDPQEPEVPVDPNTPSTGPPAEGKFGIGLVAYNWLVLNRPGNVTAVRQIAANYEWAAKALETKSIKEVGDELTKRNELIYEANKSLQPLREAIREIGNRHVNVSGLIKTLSEFQTAYQETSIGIRAAVGK